MGAVGAFPCWQALLKKVDESWNGMLEALASAPAGGDGTFEEGGVVTAESWIARASALALCARDHGANSDAAMSGWVVFCFGRSPPGMEVLVELDRRGFGGAYFRRRCLSLVCAAERSGDK